MTYANLEYLTRKLFPLGRLWAQQVIVEREAALDAIRVNLAMRGPSGYAVWYVRFDGKALEHAATGTGHWVRWFEDCIEAGDSDLMDYVLDDAFRNATVES